MTKEEYEYIQLRLRLKSTVRTDRPWIISGNRKEGYQLGINVAMSIIKEIYEKAPAVDAVPMEFAKEEPRSEPTKPTAAQEPSHTAAEDKPAMGRSNEDKKRRSGAATPKAAR